MALRPCGRAECRLCHPELREEPESESLATALVGIAAIVLLGIVAFVLLPVLVG